MISRALRMEGKQHAIRGKRKYHSEASPKATLIEESPLPLRSGGEGRGEGNLRALLLRPPERIAFGGKNTDLSPLSRLSWHRHRAGFWLLEHAIDRQH